MLDSEPPAPDQPARSPKLLDQVRRLLQARHMSAKTTKSYLGWIRRYILFHGVVSHQDGTGGLATSMGPPGLMLSRLLDGSLTPS